MKIDRFEYGNWSNGVFTPWRLGFQLGINAMYDRVKKDYVWLIK